MPDQHEPPLATPVRPGTPRTGLIVRLALLTVAGLIAGVFAAASA